jgi:UDP-2,3-diacylglucosamine pyrophosphatase LpxH
MRSAFLSDLHLGSRNCQVEALIEFLGQIRCQQLYLVGDVFDLWWMTRFRARFGKAERQVIAQLDRLARRGTEVIYIPGNHDHPIRNWSGLPLARWKIRRRAVHSLLDGRRLLVTHGDEFDSLVRLGGLEEWLGEQMHEVLLSGNRWTNRARQALGLPYWSLANFLKSQSSRAERFIERFRRAVLADVRRRGLDGVVCGHVHLPELRQIDGLIYANDGDWVESLTAITEDLDGRLALVRASAVPLMIQELAPATTKRLLPEHGSAESTAGPDGPAASCRAIRSRR